MKPIADELARAVHSMPIEELPMLVGMLAQVQAQCQVRMLQRHPEPLPSASEPTVYLTVAEVAARFHVTPKWLYRHKKQMPHSQPSRKVLLFPEQAIAKWFASRKGA